MGKLNLLVISAIICLTVSSALAQRGSREKSGVCPKTPDTFGICSFDPSKNCVDDGACPRNQKCCSDGCNKICQDPQQKVEVESRPPGVVKRGICPKAVEVVGICSFDPSKNCNGDDGCPGVQKCCANGCGSVCKDPERRQRQKLGRCPKNTGHPGICQINAESCGTDTDCPTNLKCCSDSCNLKCLAPVLGRRA